jgi:hypothetical protein
LVVNQSLIRIILSGIQIGKGCLGNLNPSKDESWGTEGFIKGAKILILINDQLPSLPNPAILIS